MNPAALRTPSMGQRRTMWEKPRIALALCLGFGAWVAAGAAAMREPEMIAFGAICAGCGLVIYGTDCGLHWLLKGRVRPWEVFRKDVIWTAVTVFVALVTGLAAPLYV